MGELGGRARTRASPRTALYAPASFLLTTTIIFLAVDSLVALTPFPPLALMASCQ
ncbi:MAG: hypothetical protein ACLTDR_13935 [Adlercreutzia equolifaciens]